MFVVDFQGDSLKQFKQGLHCQINVMNHTMDPYKMRSIVVMNLFYNITIGALKYIKHIKHYLAPKHMNLWAIWSFHKSPPIIKAFIITLVKLSLLNPLIIWSKEMELESLLKFALHNNGYATKIGYPL